MKGQGISNVGRSIRRFPHHYFPPPSVLHVLSFRGQVKQDSKVIRVKRHDRMLPSDVNIKKENGELSSTFSEGRVT